MGDAIWIGMAGGLLMAMACAAWAEGGQDAPGYAALCLLLAIPFVWMAVAELRGGKPRRNGFEVHFAENSSAPETVTDNASDGEQQ